MNTVLAEKLIDAIRSVHTGGPYALVDYPMYNNPGDAAIWCGSRNALEAALGAPPAYVSTLRRFDTARVRSTCAEGAVYFLGGGNFGGLYPKHHGRRLDAINAIAGIPVVCLPFSIAGLIEDRDVLSKTARVLSSHGAVSLMARDQRTAMALANHVGVTPLLAPDAAHAMPLEPTSVGSGTLHLLRDDPERLSVAFDPSEARIDWPEMRELRRLNRIGKAISALLPAGRQRHYLDHLAERRVALACCRLSAHEKVVTDRLHGVLLSSALGLEVEARDNSTGKLSAYLETWHDHLPGISVSP